MGSLSINKGKRAERDIASRLNAVLDRVTESLGVDRVVLRRNLKQTQIGGYDLEGLDWMAPEVKHCKSVTLPAWWRQACAQARPGQKPVLFYKAHGGPWRVRMEAMIAQGPGVYALVDISIDDFIVWFEHELIWRLQDVPIAVDTEGLFA